MKFKALALKIWFVAFASVCPSIAGIFNIYCNLNLFVDKLTIIVLNFKTLSHLIIKLLQAFGTVDPVYSERVGAVKTVH
jgi:hypothetical protein